MFFAPYRRISLEDVSVDEHIRKEREKKIKVHIDTLKKLTLQSTTESRFGSTVVDPSEFLSSPSESELFPLVQEFFEAQTKYDDVLDEIASVNDSIDKALETIWRVVNVEKSFTEVRCGDGVKVKPKPIVFEKMNFNVQEVVEIYDAIDKVREKSHEVRYSDRSSCSVSLGSQAYPSLFLLDRHRKRRCMLSNPNRRVCV